MSVRRTLLLLALTAFPLNVFAYSRSEVVAAAVRNEFPGAENINSTYAAGPISLFGNLVMELHPVLRLVGGSRVRDFEMMGSASFNAGGRKHDCLILVKSDTVSSKAVKVLIYEVKHANDYGALAGENEAEYMDEVTLNGDGKVSGVSKASAALYRISE